MTYSAAAPWPDSSRPPDTNRYTLTSEGIRIAVSYTAIYNRLLTPLPPLINGRRLPQLGHVLRAPDHHLDSYTNRARLEIGRRELDTTVKNLAEYRVLPPAALA